MTISWIWFVQQTQMHYINLRSLDSDSPHPVAVQKINFTVSKLYVMPLYGTL